LNVLNAGEALSNHHEYTDIGSYPMSCPYNAAIYFEIGKNIREDQQQDVDDDLLTELTPERLTGGIFVEQMFPHTKNGVDDDSDTNPYCEFPVLVKELRDVDHNGEW